LDNLITPDVLTPGQFFASRRDDSAVRPLKRLMLAVLEDAIVTFQKNATERGKVGSALFDEVEQWLCDSSHEGLFSFETVCDTLAINPECLRNELIRWRGRLLDSGAQSRLARRRRPVLREARLNPARRRRRASHPRLLHKGGAVVDPIELESRAGETIAPLSELQI
jgi:hypothetical protein